MKRSKLILQIIVIILVVLVAIKFFTLKNKSKQLLNKPAEETAVVKVSPVENQDIPLWLSYAGTIKAKDEIMLYAKVSGKLTQYLVKEGDKIEKGQAVALLDRDETGLEYAPVQVESAINGIIGKTFLDQGTMVTSASGGSQGTALAVILNMDEVAVKVSAPEQDIPYIKPGLSVDLIVDAYPQEVFKGEISKVSELVDVLTRTLPMEIRIKNSDHRLKSGMFARIKILAGWHKQVIALPQESVVRELADAYVFIEESGTA